MPGMLACMTKTSVKKIWHRVTLCNKIAARADNKTFAQPIAFKKKRINFIS
jgi:hypothetical protein